MHVHIVGAGIGGLALAAGLPDHDVTVSERAPHPQTGGASVTLFGNGLAALDRLGVHISELGAEITELRFRLHDGTPLMTTDLRATARRTAGYGVRSIPRTDLAAALAARAPRVDFGHELHTLPDADLVVGADGVDSMVRRALVSAEPATPSGWLTAQGTVAHPMTCGLFLVGPAGLFGIVPTGPGLAHWWCDLHTPTEPVTLELLRTRFADYAEPAPTVLAAADHLGLFTHRTHRVHRTWGRGATTLLGDAAHAVPPTLAQGANQALDDAYALSTALSRHGDPARAARAYEAHRAPRARRMSALAATERTNTVPDPITRTLARRIPPALVGTLHGLMIRRWSGNL